jgi:hypothetical protein
MFSTTHQVTLETSNPITSSKHVHNHDNHEPIQLDEVVSAWRQWQFATLGYYPPKTYAPTPIAILYIKVTMSVCLSVCPCGQCLEFFSRHCPGEGGPARAGKDWAGGSSTGALCTGFTLVSIGFQYQQPSPNIELVPTNLEMEWI